MSVEVRNKVAELEGWRVVLGDWCHTDGSVQVNHPIPDTLDACAAAWDRHAGEHGYEWEKRRSNMSGQLKYRAYMNEDEPPISVLSSGTDAASELRDRWALLGEVLKARGV